jgi:hypothetical protein
MLQHQNQTLNNHSHHGQSNRWFDREERKIGHLLWWIGESWEQLGARPPCDLRGGTMSLRCRGGPPWWAVTHSACRRGTPLHLYGRQSGCGPEVEMCRRLQHWWWDVALGKGKQRRGGGG